jgi:DNA/RNA-binding domain of Phe-tRNA-synthetase-like protein
MEIAVSDEVRALCPGAALGVLLYTANVVPSPPELLARFDADTAELSKKYALEDIAGLPHIASTRRAYKALGKSPHEYRGASEAMLRRLVKGSGLYRINNIVDINNLVSVSSGYSIGSYDIAQLDGPVTLRRAPEDTHYAGIGKGSVNIGLLPVLYDGSGPFGNPTSDSLRAMINEGERQIMSVVYSFDGVDGLGEWLPKFKALLETYACVRQAAALTV